MAERHFLVDYQKLSFRQCREVWGALAGSFFYLKLRRKKEWVGDIPHSLEVDDLEPAVDHEHFGEPLKPEVRRLVGEMRSLGFGDERYTRYEGDTPADEMAKVDLIHSNREQIGSIQVSLLSNGEIWHSLHIYSLHGSRWLNVTDSSGVHLGNDQAESETFVTRTDPLDSMVRLHTQLMEDRRRVAPPHQWAGHDDLWQENRQWRLRQIDRFLQSGYYTEISAEDVAERRAKAKEENAAT